MALLCGAVALPVKVGGVFIVYHVKELSVGMPFAGRSDFLPALLVASSKANGVAWIPCIGLPAIFRGNKES